MILAQINIGRIIYPLEDPRMIGFTNRLDEINGIADQSAGFIWRLQDESGNATEIKAADDPNLIVNLSTWRDAESLKKFLYQTAHKELFKGRGQWFDKSKKAHLALWWIDNHHTPTVEEGFVQLEYLEKHGPSLTVFDIRNIYSQPPHI